MVETIEIASNAKTELHRLVCDARVSKVSRMRRASDSALLEDAKDALDEYEKDLEGPRPRLRHPGPRPPAPLVCSLFSSRHQLTESGLSCNHCKGSTSKAQKKAWLNSPCFPLSTVDGAVWDPGAQ